MGWARWRCPASAPVSPCPQILISESHSVSLTSILTELLPTLALSKHDRFTLSTLTQIVESHIRSNGPCEFLRPANTHRRPQELRPGESSPRTTPGLCWEGYEEATFAPTLNRRSMQLLNQRNAPDTRAVHERLQSAGDEIAQRRDAKRTAKAAAELAECTFQPNPARVARRARDACVPAPSAPARASRRSHSCGTQTGPLTEYNVVCDHTGAVVKMWPEAGGRGRGPRRGEAGAVPKVVEGDAGAAPPKQVPTRGAARDRAADRGAPRAAVRSSSCSSRGRCQGYADQHYWRQQVVRQ